MHISHYYLCIEFESDRLLALLPFQTVNSAMCDRTTKVMYACPHVVKATQIYISEVTAATGGTNWSFEMDFLD